MDQTVKMIIALFVTLSLLSTIAYFVMTHFFHAGKGPCEEAIAYRIGNVDERFDISQEEVIRIAKNAEIPWESAVGRELFVYDPEAAFAINFVYDQRQQLFDQSRVAMDHITSDKEDLSDQSDVLDQKEDQYERELKKYEKMLAIYENDIADYNATVQKWNVRGGAPEDVFEELESTQKELEVKSTELSKQTDKVNLLAVELNEDSSDLGDAAREINVNVHSYNALYGTERAFDQGTFSEKEINVFQFAREEDLTLVLVHEFGHALGIGHVEDVQAIMYPMLGDQDLNLMTLQKDDRDALFEICSGQ